MELGLHIADFTWNGGSAQLGSDLATHAQSAEAAGITRITVMDHFWQITPVGPIEHDMLEAYTTLGFLAAHTKTVRLHTLVTGVIYREPAMLAKQISTLDVLSGGRAGLGVGAAWNAEESEGLGFTFPSTRERFERLEEALQICLQMWSNSEDAYEGTHYKVGRTLNVPQPLQKKPYPMIGGGGEKRTLRLVAEYADACNLFGSPEELSHKLDVLRAHCDELGRPYDQIEKTTMLTIDPSSTKEDVIRQVDERAELGFTAAYVFAREMTEPERIIELLGSVVPEIA